MPILRFRTRSVSALHFAITLTVLLSFPLSLSSQTNSFSLFLDLDESVGDQAVQSLDVSPNQDISIQIFGTDIQNASHLSVRFEYDATDIVYAEFDAGDVIPNAQVVVEQDSTTVSRPDGTSLVLLHNGTSFIEINMASDSSATVNSDLIGTLHFRTTDAFSRTEILLVRAELNRNGQGESAVLNVRVALQVAAAPSPDFDGSGFVDSQDYSLLHKVFGYREGQDGYEAKYDLNGDGEIGLDDFFIFIRSYGKWMQRAPVFTSRTYVTHFIDENTPGSEPIGDPISATDADGDVLAYRLSGTDVDLFVIDARTGQIQTREGITYDYEYRTTYSVIVEVSDTQGGTARLLVIIKINDLKEPPSSPPSNFLVIPDNESLTVHFSDVPDERGRPPVRGYHAEIRKGEDGEWGTRKTIYGRTNTSVYYHEIDAPLYQNSFLENDHLYQVRVLTWNRDGVSAWSAPVSGTPVYTPPKEDPKLVQFQDEDDRVQAVVDLSHITGEGGRIIVTRASLPATIPQEEVEGIFLDIVEVEVSNAPNVPALTGFTILGSSSLFNIELKARVNNQDVDIGDALRTSVEICLPVPEDISDPLIIHYNTVQNAWTMLDRQRVDGDVVCGYTDMFSLFGVVEIANRAPVVVGAIEPQTLRVGGEGVTVDVSGNFHDPDSDVLTYTAASSGEAIVKVDVVGSVLKITPVGEGTATIIVTARDAAGSNQTAEQTIAVKVRKAEEKLSFGGVTIPAQTYTVGRKIDAIQLPEATGGTGTIGYTLTPALPEGLTLDAETHTISGTPTVAIEATEYKWQAIDADKNTVELTFSITVESANHTPRFISNADFEVEENALVVGTVVAEDADIDDSITGYGIVDGADGSQFSIGASTSVLTFKTAPNYEDPTDLEITDPANAAKNNEYIVIVTATGGAGSRALTVRDTLKVTVTDVNEAPGKPSAPTVSTSTMNSLTVSWSAPTNKGPEISAYDMRYILTSASDEDKADDSNWTETADAWTNGSLEYTIGSLNQNTGYDVQVRAKSDEGTGPWSDSVTGTTSANSAPVANGKIYWSDNGTDKIQRSNLDGSNVEDLVTRPTLSAPVGIALDISGGKMYWIDEGTDKIQRSNLDGSNVEDLVTTGLTAPSGIALDISGGKLYWVDRGTDKIQRSNLDGSNVEDLVTTGLTAPSGIALDISGGKMYWVDRGTDKIQRSNLDGSSVEDLVTGVTDPRGIALDISGGKMYWVDNSTDKIQRSNLDGSSVEDLVTGVTDPRGIALDISGGKMYWVDNSTDKIQRSNLDGSSVEDVITTGLTTPVSIALDVISGQILTVGTSGTVDVSGYFTDPDDDALTYGVSSSDTGIATVSVVGSVVTISPVSSGRATITLTARDGHSSVQQTFDVTVVAPPPENRKIYWSDNSTDKIQRANLDGSSVEDLVTRPTLGAPVGIALDISGGKIYWIDESTDKIQRTSIELGQGETTRTVEDLVTTGLTAPSGIALDISGGKMYWVDRGTDKIQRSNLDGSNVEDLVTTGLTAPSGIALDISGGKMYWVDRGTDKIQRSNLDGSSVEDLVTGVTDPRGIALDISGGKMYWVDNGADKIQRTSIELGQDKTTRTVEDLVTGVTDPRGIALDISGGKMYWVDNSTDKIQRSNLDGSNVEDVITTGLTTPVSIALDF